MANTDKKGSSYTWLNIVIIFAAIITLGYILYTYYNSNSNQGLNDKKDYLEEIIEEVVDVASGVTAPEVVEQDSIVVDDVQEPQTEVIAVEDNVQAEPFIQEEVATAVVVEALPVIDTPPFLLSESTEEIIDNYTDILKDSDETIYSILAKFSLQSSTVRSLLSDNILRNTVVFVENFSQGHFLSTFSPMLAPKEHFMVKGKGQKLIVDPRTYQRYTSYANYINSVDSKAFVLYYKTLKPSIDDFYAEIARPGVSFDETLATAIEVVLSTPVIYEELEVKSPSVMYLYNDPKLESLNNAQKLLLRMGPNNLAKIKHKLRSIKAELAISEH